MTARQIEIVEVSPRDGLQNEREVVSTDDKVRLINDAIAAGVRRLEVASMVNPKRVPQMADGEAVLAALPDRDDVTYIALVLNMRGLERALDTKADEAGAVAVATDTFAQKNQGQTSDESVRIAADIVKGAVAAGRCGNVTISAAFGCPFEGEVPVARVADMAAALSDSGAHEIAIADTIGVGDPWKVREVVAAVQKAAPGLPLRAHFHNTRNSGIANAYAAVEAGVTTLDSSIAGLGGCPFAPAATGNIPTEDLVYMLERGGVSTGVELGGLVAAAKRMTELLGRPLPAMVSKAGAFPPEEEAA